MYFEKEVAGGRHFAELERKADGTFGIKRRGFITRYKGTGYVQMQQATESPLFHDGGQSVLSTATDFRNSTLTGTTLQGPNGSGQFLAVTLSTARTITLFTSTMLNTSTGGAVFYGICQNKPRPGDAVDVGIFGVSKVVGGSTAIIGGSLLQASSTASGVLTPFVGGNGKAVGMAIENCLSVGAVFTAFISVSGMSGSSS